MLMRRTRAGALLAAAVTFALLATVTGVLDATASTVSPPGGLPTSSTDDTFTSGSYIIDLGSSISGGVQTKPNGLRPYGLLYDLLVKKHIPVVWAIKDGKTGGRTGITPATATSDFTASVRVDRAGPAGIVKSYLSGAFIIPAEYVNAAVDASVAAFEASTVVDVATQSFTAPAFTTLESWPKAVLDAANGSIVAGYYGNAGVPNETSAYIFKSPSQLTSCDDVYLMPHADPTWATHRYLLDFNNQGGAIWAACHAVSVLESIRNPADATQGLNFLSEDKLTLYGAHGGGTVPYSYSSDGSDPVMQLLGPVDGATLNGSEQIFLPLAGTRWRPTTKNLVWDDSWPLNTSPVRPAGEEARVMTYGRGFGQATNGLVMYEGGHSHNKGTADDVAAQRALFNFLLLNGIERGLDVTVAPVPATIGSGSSVTVSATVDGGNPAYSYQWESACGGTFATPTGTLTVAGGSISTTFTAPSVASSQNCAIRLVVTDGCGRVAFSADSSVVGPAADLSVTKTVSDAVVAPGDPLSYTIIATNHGPSTATSVSVVDTLPAGLTFASATGSPVVTGQVVTWSVPSLAAGQSASFTLGVTTSTPGTVDNSVTVSSPTADPEPDNNTAGVSALVVNGSVGIVKTARPEIVPAGGGNVTYEYEVRNSGQAALTVNALVDNPTCPSIVWDGSGDLNGNGKIDPAYDSTPTEVWRYSCTRFVDLATADVDRGDGDTDPFLAVNPLPGTKQNVVKITATDDAGTVVVARDAATVTVSQPGLSVSKELFPAGQQPPVGGNATFRISITNTGNLPLSGLNAADAWPGDCSVASLPPLDLADTYAFDCDATVTAPGPLATAAFDTPATPDATASYAEGSGWAAAWAETGEVTSATAGDLQVLDAAGAALPAGYSGTNVLRFQGASNAVSRALDLSGAGSAIVRFAHHRPAAFNGSASSGLTVESSPDGATWTTLGTVTPSGSASADAGWTTVSLIVPDLAAGSTIRFGGGAGFGTDPLYLDDVEILGPATNTVTVSGTDPFGSPVSDTDTASVPLGVAALSVTKTADLATVRHGDTLTYTVTVANTGSVDQTGVQLTDTLPSGLTLVSATGTVPGGVVATEAFDAIAYGGGTGWSGNWSETGETTNPAANDIRVVDGTAVPLTSGYSSPNVLRVKNKNNAIERLVDLAGSDSATVTLRYLRAATFNNTGAGVSIAFEYTTDSGATWTTLPSGTITPSGTAADDGAWTTFSASLPIPTAPALGGLRIHTGTGNRGEDTVYFDDVTIERGPTSTSGLPSPSFDLAAGESATWTIVATVDGTPDDGLQFSNLARATSNEQTDPATAAASTPLMAPDFSVTKEAERDWVNAYDAATHDVDYVIEVRNTGNVALTPSSVADPLCNAAPAYQSGDADGDGLLDLAEVWRYGCTRTIAGTAFAATPVEVDNTVTATFTDPGAGSITRTADATVTVAHPRIAVSVDPTAETVRSGEEVTYLYTLTNTGNVELADPAIAAANCADVVYVSGDDDADGVLDVGESWIFTCTTDAVLADQVGQVVTGSGTDPIFASIPTDTETVAVNVVDPALTITKSAADSVTAHSGNQIEVGPTNAVTYTYVVTNTGDVELTPDAPFDDRCAPLSYASGDTGSPGVLSPAESWTYHCGAQVLASTTINTAVATATFSEPGLSGTVSSDAVTATATVLRPGLQIIKRADAQYVRAGTTVHYTYELTNSGETAFTQAGLGTPTDTVDTVGGTTACASISGPFDAANGGNAIAGGVSLLPGDTWYYRCATTVNDRVLNVFSFPDALDVFGNAPPEAIGVEQVFVLDPDLSVTKTATSGIDGPGTAVLGMVGAPVTYTIAVTGSAGIFEPAPGTPLDPSMTDASILVTVVDDPTCSAPATPVLDGSGVISGDDGDGLLEPRETHLYQCTLDALAAGSPTVNVVSVTGRIQARQLDDNGDPVRADDGLADLTRTATATVTPAAPSLALDKVFTGFDDADHNGRIDAGETAAWSVTATNTGNVALTDVTITDALTGDSLACGTLAPAATCVLDTTLTLSGSHLDAGQIANTATVTGDAPDGSPVDADDDDTATIVRSPAISLAKTLDGATDPDASGDHSVGDVLTFRFVATNTGNVTLTGVTVSDPMAGLSALSCTPSAPAGLAPGAALDCTATYVVTQDDVDAGAIINLATASGTPPAGPAVEDTDAVTVDLDRSPALELTKTVSTTGSCSGSTGAAGLPAAGGTVTWCFLLTNSGNVTLAGVELTDTLLGFAPGGTQPGGLPATLAPGGTLTVSATSAVVESTTNTATASATAPVTITPQSVATVTVAAAPYTVSGIVWIDHNRNNVHDSGETLVPGIEVILEVDPDAAAGADTVAGPAPAPAPAPAAGSAAALAPFPRTLHTDGDGAYLFTGVPAGRFRVRAVTSVPGTQRTFDTEGTVDWVARVEVVDRNVTADFAAVGEGRLIGTATETTSSRPLSNVTITCRWNGLDGTAGTDDDTVFIGTTDNAGHYDLGSLPHGSYSCTATDPRDGTAKTFGATIERPEPVRKDVAFGREVLPAFLARTGAETGRLLALAGALLLAGFGMLTLTRRRRSTP